MASLILCVCWMVHIQRPKYKSSLVDAYKTTRSSTPQNLNPTGSRGQDLHKLSHYLILRNSLLPSKSSWHWTGVYLGRSWAATHTWSIPGFKMCQWEFITYKCGHQTEIKVDKCCHRNTIDALVARGMWATHPVLTLHQSLCWKVDANAEEEMCPRCIEELVKRMKAKVEEYKGQTDGGAERSTHPQGTPWKPDNLYSNCHLPS